MTKLWDKGIGVNQQIESFTVGNDHVIDQELVYYDCIASKAHVSVLEQAGLVSSEESEELKTELNAIIQLHSKGAFPITREQEDCHTAIEEHLTKKLGDLGQKIHTARSRNDQVLTALRLYYRDKLQQIDTLRNQFMESIDHFVGSYGEIPYPGYTHMQKAMPSSFGLWGGAFIESMRDNGILLAAVSEIIDQSPLGTAAGYGVPLDIDRNVSAQELDFPRVQENPIYAQQSRGKFESLLIHLLSQISADLNKLASDLILFNMTEFGFIDLPEEFCTGSSIMPQKKNPDVLELMRAKHHVIKSLEYQISSMTSNLISGYNRDLQLTKESVMKALAITIECLEISVLLFKELKVNEDQCRKAMSKELFATAEAYELVKQGVPFREAYQQVAKGFTKGS
ncbi:MAG: argininosuccinate lyase [Candidatus Marinimicrobia bacterium]|nr:argininosuccinate lyase [Candidatus Neomarinimicrobiota bacterium]